MTKDTTVEEILTNAKTFYSNVTKQGKQPSWFDYERFKKQLHDIGKFGYEYQLAEILNL